MKAEAVDELDEQAFLIEVHGGPAWEPNVAEVEE